MVKQPLIVLGCGGNAVDAFDTLQTSFEVVAFVDDSVIRQGHSFQGVPVMSRSALTQYPDAMVVSLIGSEKTFSHREKIIGNFGIKLARFATVIHPKSNVSSYASLGYDVIVHAGVTIPSNAKIGNHTFILPNTVIHHDVVVEDYCVIGANVVIAGGVIIEKNCYLGSSSSIKNDLRIGSGSLVGMAANVLKSCDENAILIGNPARAVNTKK